MRRLPQAETGLAVEGSNACADLCRVDSFEATVYYEPNPHKKQQHLIAVKGFLLHPNLVPGLESAHFGRPNCLHP